MVVSVNRERPKLDFDSKDVWQWGCVAVVGRTITGFWEWWEILRVKESVFIYLFIRKGDKRMINEKVRC